jgi:hypothetical protein
MKNKKLKIFDILLNRAETFKKSLISDSYDVYNYKKKSQLSATKEYGWVSKLMNLILNSNDAYDGYYYKECFGEANEEVEGKTSNKALIKRLKKRKKYINDKYNHLVPGKIDLEDFLRWTNIQKKLGKKPINGLS